MDEWSIWTRCPAAANTTPTKPFKSEVKWLTPSWKDHSKRSRCFGLQKSLDVFYASMPLIWRFVAWAKLDSWRRFSRVGPRRNPRWKLSSGEATSVALGNAQMGDCHMPLGASRAVGRFRKSIVLHFFAFLNGRSRNNNNNNMKNIHMVTYRVQSDAQVGGSQAHQGGTTLKMLGRWNVEFDSPSFDKQISPRNLDEALTIGDCHVTCLMRCLVIDVISLGPVQMSNENHRASAICLVFSFDLLKFECADTFSRRQRCWSLPWLLSWNMSPRPQRFSAVQLCDPQEFYTCRGWSCRRPQGSFQQKSIWNWNPRSEEGAKLTMVENGWIWQFFKLSQLSHTCT